MAHPATPDERRAAVKTEEATLRSVTTPGPAAQTAQAADPAAAARHARFGTLPERIRYEDMTEEKAVTPQDVDRYNPESSWNHFNCLALDLGL